VAQTQRAFVSESVQIDSLPGGQLPTGTVRYIHLNPLRAGLIESYGDLSSFAFCGHGAILGRSSVDWQNTDYVLKMFAGKRRPARQRYEEYVKKESAWAAGRS
jgi:hypothetical protein